MTGWNIADVLDVVANQVPDALAVVQGERRYTWREFSDRTDRLAATLLRADIEGQQTVALYTRNRPEYLESFVAALKASLIPVNTNYRYGPAEITYLWQDAQARAVVFEGSFAPVIEQMRADVPEVALWLWVDDGTEDCPPWAVSYERAIDEPAVDGLRRDRSGDDLILLYTGGTTGLPKGVMWRQDDLFVLLANQTGGRYPDEPDLEFARSKVVAPARRHLPAAPLMHGAGCLTCVPFLIRGGAIVMTSSPSFDPIDLLDTIEREQVTSVGWVGDAFAKPVLAALDAEPGRWNLTSWSVVTSGGVLFSDSVKRGLLRHLPDLVIADVYGSTEAVAAARSITTTRESAPVRSFEVGKAAVVFDDDDRIVAPGSGQVGRVAFSGRLPLGYFRDEAKTASTFRTIDGVRYSFTGDFATVEPDGSISLLGRGSACINTGGEKVFPDEVEEILKRHPSVDDVVVLGLPDDRFGERVTAAIKVTQGFDLDVDVLTSLVRQHLAGYKVPRQITAVGEIQRGPNGKADVTAVRAAVEMTLTS
jgi:acyl-CoA synthetase (AMP-forming)/AMP-acid ligase II